MSTLVGIDSITAQGLLDDSATGRDSLQGGESIVMPSCAIALREAAAAAVVSGHLFTERNGKGL